MLWVVLILLSAVALGVYDVCKKHAVHGNAVMPVLWMATTAGTVVVVLAQLLTGQLGEAAAVGWMGWWQLLLKSALVMSSWICAYYAMRALPISIAAPIRGSQPVWTLAGALLLFRERPGPWQWAGILTAFVGYFVLSVVGKREGIRFHRHHGIWLIVMATVLGAASGLYDKYLLQPAGLKPAAVQLWFQVDLSLLIGAAVLIQRRAGWAKTAFQWRWTILAVGLLLAVSDFLYFTALHQPDVMISILSPIRRSNCVISFLVGGAIFGDQNRRSKAVALGMVVVGVILLCLA